MQARRIKSFPSQGQAKVEAAMTGLDNNNNASVQY